MRKTPNAELERKSVEEFKSAKKIPIVIFLDNIRSLNNVGSAFRTADAFLIERIILGGITGKPPHRDIQKTALGATDSITWEHHADVLEAIIKLKNEGYKIVSVEQADDSAKLDSFAPSSDEKYCLVFGNEVFGVDQKIVDASDIVLEIPQYGTKHSLNISVSLGIVVWEFFKSLGQDISNA